MKTVRLGILLTGVVAVAAGCPQCAPGQVGTGVAQLTVRNLGAVASVVNADDSCGFAAASVLSSPTFEGTPGGQGVAIYTVTDCEVDLGSSLTEIGEDCEGNTTSAQGKVTVTATRRVGGLLTGDPTRPVIPGGPDSVTLTFNTITAEGFRVEKSNSLSVLQWNSGSISAALSPRLAVSSSTGACAVASPITAFTSIVYDTMECTVTTETNAFDVTVLESNLTAQNGKKGDAENAIDGDITVFDTPVVIEGELDPEYDADAFTDGWKCAADLADPISFECIDLAPRLADGASRLTVKTFGTIAGIVNADTTCGFATSTLAPTVVGDVGGPGTATFAITDCSITLPTDTALAADCSGNTTTVGGTFSVTGQKVVSGVLSGSSDPARAVIPSSDGPGTLTLTITGEDFSVVSGPNTMVFSSGTLAGSLTPRTALGTDTGVCSVSTPNATFTDLVYTDAALHMETTSGNFDLVVATSNIDATNGSANNLENALSGAITLDGESFSVPADGAGLDPEYSAAAFAVAYQCSPELVQPVSFACDTNAFGAVADGAARLSLKTLGAIASIVNADTTCGFSSAAAGGTAALVGEAGGAGALTLTITNCPITFPADTALTADCNGDFNTVGGSLSISGTKTVSGVVSGSHDPASLIIPVNDGPGTLTITIVGTNFSLDDGTNTLTMASGTLAGAVTPRTALSNVTGTCSVTTSGATLADASLTNANLTIASPSGTYGIFVDTASLDAVNGVVGAEENELAGTVSVNGESYTVPSDGEGLNPDYFANDFPTAFECHPEIGGVAANYDCDVNAFGRLAGGAASLSARTFGTVVSLVEANTTCGFTSVPVAIGATYSPDDSVAGDKDVTATFTLDDTAGCPLDFGPTPVVVATDCLGNTTSVKGSVVVRGSKSVVGFRSGDPTAPIVPSTRDPATFDLELSFSNDFEIISSASVASLSVASGTLSGTMSPRVGLAKANGTCSVSTPNATFGDLVWGDAVTTLNNDGALYTFQINTSSLVAQNGTNDVVENEMTGSVTIGGQAWPLGTFPLDPAYDAAVFESTYSCNPAFQPLADGSIVPPVDGVCMQFLAEGAARLLIRNGGVLASALDKNPLCGFAAGSTNQAPTGATGNPGEQGSLTFSTSAGDGTCPIAGPSDDFVIAQDCLGISTVIGGGAAVVTGEKVVTGLRAANPPIIPLARDAASFTLSNVSFAAFELYGLAPGQVAGTDRPAAASTITGAASVTVSPIAGQSIAASANVGAPVYSISTPVAGISVSVTDPLTMTIENGGKFFTITVDAAEVTGFNGSYYDNTALVEVGSNDVSGTISVDGVATGVAVGSPLDVAYDQTVFDLGYSCTPDLTEVVPSAAP